MIHILVERKLKCARLHTCSVTLLKICSELSFKFQPVSKQPMSLRHLLMSRWYKVCQMDSYKLKTFCGYISWAIEFLKTKLYNFKNNSGFMYFEKSKFLYVQPHLKRKNPNKKIFKRMNKNKEVKKQTNKLNWNNCQGTRYLFEHGLGHS